MKYWRSGNGASSANKHSCEGGWKTCLATYALSSEHTHWQGGTRELIYILAIKKCWNQLLRMRPKTRKPPLPSVLQPKTEVRSQVNIPPSRCLQHASGRDKTRPATPPYLQTPWARPILAPEPLQTVSRVKLSGRNQWHISPRWKTIFFGKVIREIWHSSH